MADTSFKLRQGTEGQCKTKVGQALSKMKIILKVFNDDIKLWMSFFRIGSIIDLDALMS